MINRDYQYTENWDYIDEVKLPTLSLYLYAHDAESRSDFCAPHLRKNNPETVFEQISLLEEDMMKIERDGTVIPLTGSNEIRAFVESYNTKSVYLEVTGMSCRLVAPLLITGLKIGCEIHVVYSEPARYKIEEFQNEGLHKDLSEAVGDIYSLPGLEKVFAPKKEPLFVTLLGFEGGRLTFIIEDQQPSPASIRPIVGVPGYQLGYPYETYYGNRHSLRNKRCWHEVVYAEANSIVDAYLTLDQIAKDNTNPYMIVAPIGTKPHAIGAILYAIKHRDEVELLYDNPKRNVHRTDGIGKILSCNVTKLLNEN